MKSNFKKILKTFMLISNTKRDIKETYNQFPYEWSDKNADQLSLAAIEFIIAWVSNSLPWDSP